MSTIRSNDRASLCSFMFVDGRKCRIPRAVDHPYLCDLCAFHARKEAQTLAGKEAGKDIAYHLSASFVSACDLSSALGRLFSAVAQGHVKPKTASTLAYLGQTLVQALHLAQDEYIQAYGTNSWRETIRTSHEQSIDHFADNTEPDPSSSDPESPDAESSAPESPDSSAPESPDPEPDPAPEAAAPSAERNGQEL